MNAVYPTPTLTLTAAHAAPGAALPIMLAVENPTVDRLSGATAELTLEVERGVLISWYLQLADMPASSVSQHVIVAAEPPLTLPLNVPPGRGQLRLTLSAADGTWLNQVELELRVGG